MWNGLYIILGILSFSILVIGHELGHFTLAKLNGVRVDEFSIGMGPKIFGIKGKETEYLIKAFPIGGYVRMFGEEEEVADPRAFSSKSAVRRLSIIAAGPIMNLLLAVVLFMSYASVKGIIIPQINGIGEGRPAQRAGLQAGDRIISINNKKIDIYEEMITEINMAKGKEITLVVKRDGRERPPVKITPEFSKENNQYEIGVTLAWIKNPGFFLSAKYGVQQVKGLAVLTLDTFKGLFQRKVSANDVGGPITIIKMSGEVAKAGLFPLMGFIAFLSINLAVFNLIPFPALDGGWIFLLLVEIITRKKMDQKKVAIVNFVGFACLMLLMVAVTIKDIIFPVNFGG